MNAKTWDGKNDTIIWFVDNNIWWDKMNNINLMSGMLRFALDTMHCGEETRIYSTKMFGIRLFRRTQTQQKQI